MRVLAAALLMGCGDKDTGASSEDSAEDTTEIDCVTELWADQTEDTRAGWMAACVLPDMQTLFQGHDADSYGDFSCASCHGADLGGGTYAMPAAKPIAVREQDPGSDIYLFMYDEVMQEMADKLGVEAYNTSTGAGEFSCYSCHLEDE
ncbi:MAG: hypothetical protein ACI8RZ_006215 [Myxococcota bacterium]|jgi:hypothetical protein